MDNTGTWNKWYNVHNDEDQVKRFSLAKKGECTPSKISNKDRLGNFIGSKGAIYATTLNNCSCVDFNRRKLPCKHMYRLAIELGLIFADVEELKIKLNSIKSLTFADAVSLIESLQQDSQILFKSFLLDYIYHKKNNVALPNNENTDELLKVELLKEIEDYKAQLQAFSRNELNELLIQNKITGFRKNMSLEKLSDWCVGNIPDSIPIICSNTIAVTLAPQVYKAKTKIYSYLHRKLDKQIYLDENLNEVEIPAGSTYSISITPNGPSGSPVLAFPNDEVTFLLDKYNVNPCKNYKINT